MVRKQTTPRKPVRRWRIVMARHRGAYLGVVEAESAEAAVEIAAKRFGVPAWRLIAEAME